MNVFVNVLHAHQLKSAAFGTCSCDPFGQLPGPGCQFSLRSQRAEALWHWYEDKLTQ